MMSSFSARQLDQARRRKANGDSILEVQLESELNNTRPRAGTFDATKIRTDDVVVRIRVVHPVEDVEELGSKLTAKPFRKRNVFDERDIDVFLAGAG